LLDLEAELLKNADYFTVLVHLLEKGGWRTSLRCDNHLIFLTTVYLDDL
jgi:hypothetical protein